MSPWLPAQIELDVGGLVVGALRPGSRQRIAPEVLDVLDVFLVGFELVDEAVVVLVGFVAERLVALQHDHRRAVGVELLEVLADALHRLHRRRVGGRQRHRMRLADHFQLRRDDVYQHRQRQPAQQDRHREEPDEPRDHRVRADMRVAHADFTRQKVWALRPSVVFSFFTTPSTVIRQLMVSPSPCATMLGLAAGAVVVSVSDHGSGDVPGLLRLSVEVEVVDGGDGSGLSVDLVRHDFGVERRGVVDQARAGPGQLGLAEYAAESVHHEEAEHDHRDDEQRHPETPQYSQHWKPRRPHARVTNSARPIQTSP